MVYVNIRLAANNSHRQPLADVMKDGKLLWGVRFCCRGEISATGIIKHMSVFWLDIYLSVALTAVSRSLNKSDCPRDLANGSYVRYTINRFLK